MGRERTDERVGEGEGGGVSTRRGRSVHQLLSSVGGVSSPLWEECPLLRGRIGVSSLRGRSVLSSVGE